MSLGRESKTCFISFILILSSLSVFVIIPENVKAEELAEGTTLYFHHCDLEMLGGVADQNLPVGDNDSAWPPRLKDGVDEFITWAGLWFLIEGNLTELFGGEDIPGFGDLFKELFNPLEYIGIYENTDEETLEINGDIVFDLYFSSTLASKLLDKDSVKVSVSYGLPTITEEIKNVTKILEPKLKGEIQKYEIKIEDINCDLEPGEFLTFSIELIPSDKPIHEIIEQIDEEELKDIIEEIEEIAKDIEGAIDELINLTEPILGWLGNESIFSKFDEFKESLEYYLEFFNESEIDMENVSLDDIADLVNILRSSSFIYDSIQHPSSVTLPVKIEGVEEDIRVYYLHEGGQMDGTRPTKDESSEIDLSKDSVKWDGAKLDRSKMLKEAMASLYIDHRDLYRIVNLLRGEITVTAALFDGDDEIASSDIELDKTSLLDLLQKSDEPTTFTFSDLSHEVEYNHGLSLKVYVSNGNKFGLGLYRAVKLLYDSKNYPSSLTVKFEETNHINIEDVVIDPSNKKIVPGGSVKYTFNVTSKYAEDEIEITTSSFSDEEKDNWDILIDPESFSLSASGTKTVEVIVTSTFIDRDAYEEDHNSINVTFAVTGKTGKAMFDAEIEISEDAVEYDIVVIDPPGQKIKRGETGTYHFKIINNNTGLWPDSYTIEVSSGHNWTLDVDYKKADAENVDVGEEFLVNVTISIPKDTDVSSDLLIFTITSEESKKHDKDMIVVRNITTTVIGPNILEMLYEFFESAAEDLGLDKVFGSSYLAAVFLAALLFIIIFFIIILLVYLLKKKFVNIVCLERIKEINPDKEAVFEITIKNPTKKTRNYEISSQENPMSPKWDTSLEPREVTLEPEQSKTVVLTVKPTDLVQPDNWMEAKVVVNTVGKQKLEKITTMTIIKDAKPELNITGVFHWPRTFKKGERVETSFKLENKGNASANNVTIVLYVNGEEKNKVEDITIPRGGYVDIEMPWIAVKGKNEISIVVR